MGAEDVTLVGGPEASLAEEPAEEGDDDGALPEGRARWIGRFVPIRRIGRGGFGAIYEAYDPQLDRKVALKRLRSGRGTTVNRLRLLREARALAAISHQNVVSVYEVGETGDGGAIHIAMEYIQGTGIREWIKQTNPRPRRIITTLLGVARGLEAAHAAGLAHRDIKPDNVMVTADGVPKIVDFGLAHAGHADSSDGSSGSGDVRPASGLDDLTATGNVVGTPAYMAPEQHEGHRGGPKSDQFSFSVLAYEAFEGERPFRGKTLDSLRLDLFRGMPRLPTGKLPRWLWHVLERGLALDPDDRFESMRHLREAIEKRQRRPRRLAIAGLASVAIGTPVVALVLGPGAPCAHSADAIDDVWNAAVSREIKGTFETAREELGKQTADRIVGTTEAYVARWKAGMRSNCEATRVQEAQSDAMFDLRAACYREGLTELAETVSLWKEGDPALVDRAQAVAGDLPDPEDCARVETLQGLQRLPDDQQTRADIVAIEEELARADTRFRSGLVPDGLLALEARAAETGYRPLQARVRSLAARVDRFLSRTDGFDHFSAMTVALAGGDTRTAIKAASRHCLAQRVLHDFDDAKQACELAKALLETLPEDDFESLRLELEVLDVELNLDDDLPATRDALNEIRARATAKGLEQPFLDATVRLALVEQGRGHPSAAVAFMREAVDAYAKSDGPRHPSTLSLEGDLTGLLIEAGELEEARARLMKLISWEETGNWQTRINLASVQHRLGDLDEAVNNANRARELLIDTEEYRALCHVMGERTMILWEAGRKAHAREAAAETADCVRAHPDRLEADTRGVLIGQVAWIYEQDKEYEKALEYFRETESLLRQVRDADPVKLMISVSAQAQQLRDLGRTAEAKDRVRDALHIARNNRLGTHPMSLEAQAHLRELLESLGLKSEAQSLEPHDE